MTQGIMADDDDDEDEFLICFLKLTNSDLLKVKVYLKVARYKNQSDLHLYYLQYQRI